MSATKDDKMPPPLKRSRTMVPKREHDASMPPPLERSKSVAPKRDRNSNVIEETQSAHGIPKVPRLCGTPPVTATQPLADPMFTNPFGHWYGLYGDSGNTDHFIEVEGMGGSTARGWAANMVQITIRHGRYPMEEPTRVIGHIAELQGPLGRIQNLTIQVFGMVGTMQKCGTIDWDNHTHWVPEC